MTTVAASGLYAQIDTGRALWLRDVGSLHGVLVVLALAKYAIGSGKAWPAVATIAEDSGLDRRSVQRALRKLEDDKKIARDGVSPIRTQVWVLVGWPPLGSMPAAGAVFMGAVVSTALPAPDGGGGFVPARAVDLSPEGGGFVTLGAVVSTARRDKEETREETPIPEQGSNKAKRKQQRAPKPEPLVLIPPETASGEPEGVDEVWRLYVAKIDPAARLTPKRRERIVWAIRTVGLEAVKEAINGCAASAFHMGKDRPEAYAKFGGVPKPYNDLVGNILRDEDKIEAFRAKYRAAQPVGQQSTTPDPDAEGLQACEVEIKARTLSERFHNERGDIFSHDGTPPAGEDARRFPAHAQPVGGVTVQGVRIWVWPRCQAGDDLTRRWLYRQATRYAAGRLAKEHPGDPEVKYWTDTRPRDARAEFDAALAAAVIPAEVRHVAA